MGLTCNGLCNAGNYSLQSTVIRERSAMDYKMI